MRSGVRDTKSRRAPVTMDDERMSDYDEESKSRLRWTEARRAGEHTILSKSPRRLDVAQAHGVFLVLFELVVVVI